MGPAIPIMHVPLHKAWAVVAAVAAVVVAMLPQTRPSGWGWSSIWEKGETSTQSQKAPLESHSSRVDCPACILGLSFIVSTVERQVQRVNLVNEMPCRGWILSYVFKKYEKLDTKYTYFCMQVLWARHLASV